MADRPHLELPRAALAADLRPLDLQGRAVADRVLAEGGAAVGCVVLLVGDHDGEGYDSSIACAGVNLALAADLMLHALAHIPDLTEETRRHILAAREALA